MLTMGTAYNSDPPPGLNHHFRKTFSPVTTSSDADGTTPNVPNNTQRCSIQSYDIVAGPQIETWSVSLARHRFSRDGRETPRRALVGEMVTDQSDSRSR